MAPSKTPTADPQVQVRPRVKVWFEAEGGYSFGFGLIAILQAVDRAGSIKQAASELGQSYRHIWGRIKAAEQALAHPLVETQVGGQGSNRSGLTESARRLITDFLTMRDRMFQVMEDEFAPPPEPDQGPTPPPHSPALNPDRTPSVDA
ncbi:winged helix-turn-helix domain-containing protein [Singulisphaera acidiphila]|uniref:Molybdenum-binding protein n=1 Tax=Singulisphaera acidiphila (strain ATCC BAA-1392 / DSM 18658 / VKM B-2454 / MOB10) TaxID=886293 RepID=L0D708_SINAD|nr:LysR family transcriptional regulator [Singulisphaera acidiphila]AGA25194.1 molybdenum-binding protein [Singulisphaera acidiphila DSM 18658]